MILLDMRDFMLYVPFLFLSNGLLQVAAKSVIIWAIGLASVIGLSIFIERMIFLRACRGDIALLLTVINKAITKGHFDQAVIACDAEGGVVSNVLRAGLVRYGRSSREIMEAMELVGRIELSKMERYVKILSIIAHVVPLLGLLGTVLGFIECFGQMGINGLVDMSAMRIGHSMEYALLTTAAGLIVAIPTTLSYNYLVSRISGFALEMEFSSMQLLEMINEGKSRSGVSLSISEESYETL
jgi:biopolymer transport protein ExbB